jgi:inhibitor of KinA sporulation pathway (predicted exonuclease)
MLFNYKFYVEIRIRKFPNLKRKCKQSNRDVQFEECDQACDHERRNGKLDIYLKRSGPRHQIKARTSFTLR